METYGNWRKSTRSGTDVNCVEVAFARDGRTVGLRDTKDRSGPVLEFGPAEWSAFVGGVQRGAFGRQGR